MELWLLASRGAGTDFAGGAGTAGGGGDFGGVGERGRDGGGGLVGLGCACDLCGLSSVDPSGLFGAIELVDPGTLALALGGATDTDPCATGRAGRRGGGEIGITSICEGSGPASDEGTGGIERAM